MERLVLFPPAVKIAMIYFTHSSLSYSDLGKKLGISKQAVQKQVKLGEKFILQTSTKEDLACALAENETLKSELSKARSLILHLRRLLVLRSSLLFILSCFMERIKKYWPKFDIKRFEPFEKKYLLDMAKKFQSLGGTLKEFCKAIGKSEATLTLWLRLYEKYGISGLKDKTTVPKHFSHKLPLWLKEQLVILFLRFPEWSAYQYHQYIKNNPALNYAISIAAIEKLKAVNRKLSEDEKQRIKKRWAFAENYDVWTVDFTCILKTDTYKLQLLTVSDHRSRYWFEPALFLETSTQKVIDHLQDLFIKYGKPFMVKADNGPEFKMDCLQSLNKLGVYLLNSPTYYGQFCGAHERIHRTLKDYISDFSSHNNLSKLVEEIKNFNNDYNFHWSHDYLENKTPAQIFYSEDVFVPQNAEIIKPYEKDGELRMKFTNRQGLKARISLPVLNLDSAT